VAKASLLTWLTFDFLVTVTQFHDHQKYTWICDNCISQVSSFLTVFRIPVFIPVNGSKLGSRNSLHLYP
jgi:hypothetical protein